MNTGYKAYTTLEQYNVYSGNATGVTKPNDSGDADYVAPVLDEVACPIDSNYIKWIVGRVSSPLNYYRTKPSTYFYPKNFNNITTSIDGINWVERDIPSLFDVESVKYINNQWIAVGTPIKAGGNTIAVSNDGATWIKKECDKLSDVILDIDFDGSKYIVIGASSNISRAAYSTDLISWASINITSQDILRRIVHKNNRWGIVAMTGSSAAYSDTGLTWTNSTFTTSNEFLSGAFSIEYGQGKWLIGGESTENDMAISINNMGSFSHTPMLFGNAGSMEGVCSDIKFNGNYWLAVGYEYGKNIKIKKSTDGGNWTSTNQPVSNTLKRIEYRGTEWISIDRDHVYRSTDGNNWNIVANKDALGSIGVRR
jgi:hypothetical protein